MEYPPPPPPPLQGPSGATFTGNKDRANLLNNQFCSVFNQVIDSNNLPDLGPSPFPQIPHIQVSVNGVTKKLNPHKSAGPDAIPERLLKELADSLGHVLTIIYQASIDTGSVPDILIPFCGAFFFPFEKNVGAC